MKHKGLGKGLGALIPERTPVPENHIQTVPLGQIKPGIQQPRHQFDPEKLRELADSIRSNGIIQPLILRPVAAGFELVAGERRWRAAKLAGLMHVPAIIRKIDDRQALELSLIENLQRDDLNPIEAAAGYRMLMDEYGLSQEAVAEVVGKDRSTIANMIRLLKLPEPVRDLIETGRLSVGHAKVLLGLREQAVIELLAARSVQNDWSVRVLEQEATRLRKRSRKRITATVDPDLDKVLNGLRKRYATKIQFKPNRKGGGKIILEYYNEDDLIRLIDLLNRQSG